MKFYILLTLFAIAFAIDSSSSSSSSSSSESEEETSNEEQISERFRVDKNERYIDAGVKIILFMTDSSKTYAERLAGAEAEIERHPSSLQVSLREMLYPYLKAHDTNRVRSRARRNIGHGVQPNHHEPRPGNYNPYGNANEKPHGNGHGGHSGHGAHPPGHHH